MIDRVALDALLLRAQFPDLRLREGASVVARVASRAETHGVIVLAGVPLTAELPPEVRAGETLHLRVQDVSDERVTLRLDPQAAQAAPQPVQDAAAGGAQDRAPALETAAGAGADRRTPGCRWSGAGRAGVFFTAMLSSAQAWCQARDL